MTPKTGLYIGIGVSVGLLIIAGVVAATILANRESIGEPTEATAAPGVLNKIEMNIDIGKVTTPPPASGNEADALYQAAVKEVAALGDDFVDNAIEDKANVDPDKNPAYKSILDKLEAAADKGLGDATELNFDASLPLSPRTEWTAPRSIHDKLEAMATMLSRRAMSRRDDKNREGAEKAMRAELIFGVRLFKNGIYVVYKTAAQSAISQSLGLFERSYSADFFNDPAKAAAAHAQYEIYLPAAKLWNKKEAILRSVKPGPAPADVWNLAEHDQDRAWQAEGLMWLGVAQWTWSEGAQRTAIQKYLAQKQSSPDPLLARMAKTAFETKRAGSGDFAQ
jgi:hypothetical protein